MVAVLVEGETVQGGFSWIDSSVGWSVLSCCVPRSLLASPVCHIMDRLMLHRQDKQTKARGLKLHGKRVSYGYCLM